MTGVSARTAGIAGILFAILLAFGMVLTGDASSVATDQEAIKFYADSGNRAEMIIGAYAIVVSMLCFLPFLLHMRDRLAGAPKSAAFAPIAYSAGLLFVAMAMVGAIALAWLPAGVDFGSAPVPENADLARFAPQLGFGFLMVAGGLSAVVTFGAAAIGALRAHLGPSWLAWSGLVVAILQIAAITWFALLLVPVWTLVSSILLITRPREAAGVAVPA